VCARINNKLNIIIIIIIIIIFAAASIRRAEDYQTARYHIAVDGNHMTTLRNQTVTPYVDGILEKKTCLSRMDKLVVKTPNDGGLPLPTDTVNNRKMCGRDTEGTMNTELQCCFLHCGFAEGGRI